MAKSQMNLGLRPEDLLWPAYDRIMGLTLLNEEEKDALTRLFHGKIKAPKGQRGPSSAGVQAAWYREYKRAIGARPVYFSPPERRTLKNITDRCADVAEACEMVVWFWEWRDHQQKQNPMVRIEPSPFSLQTHLHSVREYWSRHRPVGPPAEFKEMARTLAEFKRTLAKGGER